MNKVIIDCLSFALPLAIMAIGALFSEKSGISNLAVEGFQGFGAFTGSFAAILMTTFWGMSGQTAFWGAIIFGLLGGGLFAMVFALLCIKFKANQVISGVIINMLAAAVTSFMTKRLNKIVFGASSDKFVLEIPGRFTIPVISKIPVLGAVFTNMYTFEWVFVVMILIAWYLIYRTDWGLHLRACGENPHAADAAGIRVDRTRYSALFLSGACCGVGGVAFAYSISANFSSNIYSGYGFLAIAAMIFGNWSILPTLGACLIFGFTKSLGNYIVEAASLNSSYQDLALALPYIVTLILLIFLSRHNHPPAACGETYDKSKR